MSFLLVMVSGYIYMLFVSVRLVEAENLDWRLFRVSDQRLIKWFGKSCHIFELSLHLNWAMPTSLPASIVYIQHCINSLPSRNMQVLKIPQMCTWVIFEDIENGRYLLHICGVYNPEKVGNATFVIMGS